LAKKVTIGEKLAGVVDGEHKRLVVYNTLITAARAARAAHDWRGMDEEARTARPTLSDAYKILRKLSSS
jgi:hypothetical protein